MKKGSISLLLASALSACSWGGDADREAISGQRSPLTAGDHSATANAANKITVLKNWIGIAQAGGVVDILNYTGVDNTTGDAGLIKTERAFARNAGFTVAVYGAHGLPSKVQAMPKKTARGSVFIRNNPQNNAFEKYVLSVCWGGSNNGAANFIDVASWVHKYYGVAANKIIACKGGNVHPGETDMVCAGTQVVDGAGANIGPVVNLPNGTKFRLPARENEKLGPSRCGGVRGDPCEDGMDNDGDGLTDANDPDCANDPEEECTDGSDNDEDGATDCSDSDCVFEPACASPFEECDNGLDDDADGLADCEDSDCTYEPSCTGVWEDCTNGVDDDADGGIDCGDPECAVQPVCGESDCDNALDDDEDDLTDCDDPDCDDDPACVIVGPDGGPITRDAGPVET